MCQPQSKGGKRCATHMHGSMAVVTHTAIVHNADEGVVRTVFRSLRREGKNLPAPSQEEVNSFAAEQRLRAQFDPRIEDERKRNTIVRRWGRTAEESPDGGTFHAWKNSMAETARRYSHKAVAISTASVFALSAAACSGGGGSLEGTPTPTPDSTTTSAPPTSDPTTEAPQPTAIPAGLVSAGVGNDGNGEYTRIALADDSALYNYDAAIVQPDASASFSEQDITEAQRVAADFAVEEGVDSILVDSARTDEWYAQNSDKFSPTGLSSVQEAMEKREDGKALGGLVDNDVLDKRNVATNYGLKIDGGSRISELNIQKSNVFTAPNGDLAIEFSGTAIRPTINASGESNAELLTFKQTYALEKSEGKWLISGWSNSFTYGE